MPRHVGAITEPRWVSSRGFARLVIPRFFLILFSVALLLGTSPARAAKSSFACPPGNLLAMARVTDSLDIQGSWRAIADDSVLASRVGWTPARGIRFLSSGGSLTYDLGSEKSIAAAYLQASAGNAFSLQLSDDGRNYREIWKVPTVGDSVANGFATRFETFVGERGRYLRIGDASEADNARTVAELQIFCEMPPRWPPPLATIVGFPRAPTRWRLDPPAANRIRLALACLTFVLLLWDRRLWLRGRPHQFQKLRVGLLIALALFAFRGYYNWGAHHYYERIHWHEFFHYYVGSKYFPELGYTGIYESACLAEAEQGFRHRVEMRVIRDLRRNELVPATYALRDPDRIKRGFARPFTFERWESFKKDAAYFRDGAGVEAWEHMLKDHGYNPSPAWNMVGSVLANLGPASDGFIKGVLAWIDPVLLLLMFALIVWTFGWRVACIAAIFFGTSEPALYRWTGGAYMRQDWLVWSVAGICLLKRGNMVLGGSSLGISTLLRIFPIGFFVAIGLRLMWILVRERRLDRAGAKIIAGAVLATAIIVPTSSLVAGTTRAWPVFFQNTQKHTETPLTNNMGLRTVVSFRWATSQRFSWDPNLTDPFHNFKEARRRAFHSPFGWPLFLAIFTGYLALLFRVAVRERAWWILAVFGFGVIPFGAELTCYYYSFLLVAAFLWENRNLIPIGLLALAAITQVIAFETYFYDIRYMVETLAVLAFAVWATWIYASGLPKEPSRVQ
jgi:hypothetical protein